MSDPVSHCVILLGGEVFPTERLREQISGAFVIAADSGIRHAMTLGVAVDAWVGDFDSADSEMIDSYKDLRRESFPAEKDQTDGELAINRALALGARRLILVGAFGGARSDHAFSHLASALRLSQRGIEVLLTSGRQEGIPLRHETRAFDYAPGTIFSILPFGDLDGLDLDGAKWPLNKRHVVFGSSLTLSNRVTTHLVVTLKAGRAMLIAHPHPAQDF
ncbi:thiamine diphosphokinase [Limoniibacter endophyticus]|uniref:Thiamine diphosphokinase n=1 Tax=Limoniibacter endophyticus TaxID=1565040 RepID=A0A8J3DJD8_9HYPH|nr:thiamine diphosphokinase [Limoniibacter endophyticus]GHC73495.1 thiamine pyrophosphokinase [Limoniibacter endophyticus]